MEDDGELVVGGLSVGKRPVYGVFIRTGGGLEIHRLSKKGWKFHKAVVDWDHLAARLLTLTCGEVLINDVQQMRDVFFSAVAELSEKLEKNLG